MHVELERKQGTDICVEIFAASDLTRVAGPFSFKILVINNLINILLAKAIPNPVQNIICITKQSKNNLSN